MLDISVNNKLKNGNKYLTDFFIGPIQETMAETGLSNRQIGLSINLVNKNRIKSLNKKFRNKNETTDVLSFPLHELANEDLATDANKGEGDILELGDIFLCLPLIQDQALREKTDLDFKLIFLTVHGCLHLLGYDHEKSTKEEEKMLALQEKIIKKCVNK